MIYVELIAWILTGVAALALLARRARRGLVLWVERHEAQRHVVRRSGPGWDAVAVTDGFGHVLCWKQEGSA